MVSIKKMVDTNMGTRGARAKFVNGVRVNRTGRRTYTLEYKLGIVEQCRAPEASVAAIAMSHRINANLVRRWMIRYQSGRSKQPALLLPVTISAASTQSEACAPTATVTSTPRSHPGMASIEIEIYGARICLRSGVDAQALRSVLDVLASR